MTSPLSPARSALVSVKCADITAARVSWLWEPILARGKLALLDGEPGVGKSFVTIDLATRISRGLPMPGSTVPTEPGTVLLLSAEDGAADTIVPRLTVAGADMDRVRVVSAPDLGLARLPQLPDDIGRLGELIDEVEAALVVIDPMMAFFPPGISANNDQSIRAALSPLASVAAWSGVCPLLVRHPRKSGGVSAIYRGAGSVGIMGAVRTGLMIARHPDDPDLRILTLCKTNIGPPAPSLGFRLARREGTGETYVDWLGVVDVTADDLFGASVPLRAGHRSRERATEWLRQLLAGGPKRAGDVFAKALKAGIPERTLYRVKAGVGWCHRQGTARGRRSGGGVIPPPTVLAAPATPRLRRRAAHRHRSPARR